MHPLASKQSMGVPSKIMPVCAMRKYQPEVVGISFTSRAEAAFWQLQAARGGHPGQERPLFCLHGAPQGPKHDQEARPLPLAGRLGCVPQRSQLPGQ